MKKIYAVIFICIALILAVCTLICIGSKKKIARYLKYPIIFALLPTIANFILMICSTKMESDVAYAIFYSTINWLMLTLLRYVMCYTGLKPKPKWLPWMLLSITIIDSISMFLNPFLGHAYRCMEVVGADGATYFINRHLLWFNLHLAYSYVLSTFCFAALIYKLFTTAAVYWKKYIVIIASLAVVLIWDAFFVTNTSEIDKSIIGMGLCGILLTYFTLIYRQRPLIYNLLTEVVCNSSDILLFFNNERECIFANECAKNFFGVNDDTLFKAKELLKTLLKNDFPPATPEENRKIISTEWHGNKLHLRLDYRIIKKRNREEGSFYRIQNCTDDINQMERDKFRATHNELTGLYNKSALVEKTEELMRLHPDQQYYVIAFDIKNFKLLNDLFGRDIGDQILVSLAELLSGGAFPNELVGHLSGDRFVMIVKGENIETDINQFERIFEHTPDILKDQSHSIVIHAGIYKVSKNDYSIVTMFDRAFLALSSVKDYNENRYAIYDDTMRMALVWEQKIIAALDSALEKRQFEIYLQPQTDSNCNIAGAEVLVRWHHPERGLIPPNQFIKTFEKSEQISKLDCYMWENACSLLSQWKRKGREDMFVSVNLSPLDFYYIDVYATFSELVAKYDISPKNLHIEITETAMLDDLEIKLPVIERLRLAGFKFAMDDFGSGFSSLNLLKDLPVDILKLDMAFLYHAKDIAKSKIIIQQIIELAKKLGMTTITEGVETEAHLEFLKSIGCNSFQGYYFTKPIPIQDFEEKYFGWHQA